MKNNNKKQAWTMVELAICVVIIALISTFLVNCFKPNVQKARVYLYAALKNLNRANANIIEEKETLDLGKTTDDKDMYCLKLADLFTLAELPNCKIETAEDLNNKKVNLVFGNKTTLIGLTNEWVEPFDGATYKYKDVLIDIDGVDKGKNKLWLDRFPFRLYNSSGLMGIMYPISCGTHDYTYDGNEPGRKNLESPYCKGDSTDFLTDDRIITYDIYRTNNDENDQEEAFLRIAAVSPIEADCSAYGGEAIFKARHCTEKGLRITADCITDELCDSCRTSDGIDVCPKNDDGIVQYGNDCKDLKNIKNPKNLKCFTIMHKPRGGMNMLLDSALGEIDL